MREIANELIADYASAWNTHDIDALTILFHEDGTFVMSSAVTKRTGKKSGNCMRPFTPVSIRTRFYVIEQRAGLWKFTAAHNTRIVPRT